MDAIYILVMYVNLHKPPGTITYEPQTSQQIDKVLLMLLGFVKLFHYRLFKPRTTAYSASQRVTV